MRYGLARAETIGPGPFAGASILRWITQPVPFGPATLTELGLPATDAELAHSWQKTADLGTTLALPAIHGLLMVLNPQPAQTLAAKNLSPSVIE